MTEWTDKLRAKVKAAYLAAKPTAETNVEIINKIAEDVDKTPNGVRAVLVRAKDEEGNKIYITKAPSTTSKTTNGTTKVGKAESIAALKSIIENNQLEIDDAIIDKMTGKAAQYFTELFTALTTTEEEEEEEV